MSLKDDLDATLKQIRGAGFTVEYWDGDAIAYGDGEPEFLVRLTDAATVARILGDVLVELPEAYVAGRVEVEGDLGRLVALCYRVDERMLRVNPFRMVLLRLAAVRQRNSLSGARANVSHHYDLGNEFFKIWLDEDMSYSCAYFENAADDLETAQRQKLQHICTKLRLRPGHRLLDIGCGWGALAMYAAGRYDVDVVGITLSDEQRSLCQAKIQQRGLGRVRVRLQDYRQLDEAAFDRVVSVGMMEHVGRPYLGTYMTTLARCLRPGGVGVVQTISQMVRAPVTPWIAKRIFPGMYLPTLGEISSEMARCGLQIKDVENLRAHYALTLDVWIERFEKNVDTIRNMFDERFVRMWRMYLQSARAAFRLGRLNLWQITFTHGSTDEIPLTRRYIYEEPAAQDGTRRQR